MRPDEVRLRSGRHAQGGRRAGARRRPLRRRRCAGRCAARASCCARRTRMRTSASPTRRRRARCQGVRLVLTGGGHCKDLGDLPCHGIPPGVKVKVAAVSDARARTSCATSAIRSRSSSPTRSIRRAMAPRRSQVDYEPLPHIVDMEAAVEAGAPPVWADQTGNVCFEHLDGRQGEDRSGFRQGRTRSSRCASSIRASSPIISIRAASSPNTTRRSDRLTRHAVEPGPARDARRAVRQRSENAAREDARHHAGCRRRLRHQAVSLPRIRAGRGRGAPSSSAPVKWIGERTEHFLSCTQGRDNITTAKLACDENGKVPRVRRSTRSPTWARISRSTRPIIPVIGAEMLPGLYDFRPATSACAASTPTRCRSMPIAAPAAPKPPT